MAPLKHPPTAAVDAALADEVSLDAATPMLRRLLDQARLERLASVLIPLPLGGMEPGGLALGEGPKVLSLLSYSGRFGDSFDLSAEGWSIPRIYIAR